MKRRSFIALASGLLVMAPEPVRAYSFVSGWANDIVTAPSGSALFVFNNTVWWRGSDGQLFAICASF